jgi:hypothetical protein
VSADPTCVLSEATIISIAALMAENPRKRRRGKNRALEVDLDDADDSTVTYRHVEYDTPAGRFTKRMEVPYKYVPPAATITPKPSQSNVTMDQGDCPILDTGMDQGQEPLGPTPVKKRNKVANCVKCAAAGQSTNFAGPRVYGRVR